MPPPTTPKRRSERLLFKTPGRTPSREFGEAMSPNVQRTPSAMRTPKNTQPVTSIITNPAQRGLDPTEMTPFSRSIHEVLSETGGQPSQCPNTPSAGEIRRSRRTPRRVVNKDDKDIFDFPDLPSLKGSSPMSGEPMLAFNFSEMTTDHLQPDTNDAPSTDRPMPSSPPQGYFAFMHDKDEHGNDFWADFSIQDDPTSIFQDLDDETLRVEARTGSLRRSPRKHAL